MVSAGTASCSCWPARGCRPVARSWSGTGDTFSRQAHFVELSGENVTRAAAALRRPPRSQLQHLVLAAVTPAEPPTAVPLLSHRFFVGGERVSAGVVAHFAASRLVPDAELFPDKLADMGGQRLRAVTFHYPPKNMLLPGPDGVTRHDGLETRLVLAFASALNFRTEFVTPSDGGMWGGQAADGSWSGLLGDLHHDRADIGMANLFRSADKLRGIDMTEPYMTDYACFLAAVPPPPPHYLALVRPLSWRAWCATIGAFAVCVPVLWALSSRRDRHFGSLTYTAFYGFGVLMQEAMEAVPRRRAAQLFLAQFWVLTIVVTSAYRANLVAYLLAPAPATPLDTTRQLLDSGLEWGVRRRGGWEAWFQDSPDPVARGLADGMRFVDGFTEGVQRARQSSFAFINSKQSLQYLVATNFTDWRGAEMMHVSRECYIPFSVALGLPKYSPLTDKLNRLIRRSIEAGLVEKMFGDVLWGVRHQQGRRAAAQRHDTALALNISHVQAPLGLLVIGLLVSLLALATEVLWARLPARLALGRLGTGQRSDAPQRWAQPAKHPDDRPLSGVSRGRKPLSDI